MKNFVGRMYVKSTGEIEDITAVFQGESEMMALLDLTSEISSTYRGYYLGEPIGISTHVRPCGEIKGQGEIGIWSTFHHNGNIVFVREVDKKGEFINV